MGKYINRDEDGHSRDINDGHILLLPGEEKTCKKITKKIEEYRQHNSPHEFLEEVICNFLLGKDLEEEYGFNFYNVPEQVNDPAKNLENIIQYLSDVKEVYEDIHPDVYRNSYSDIRSDAGSIIVKALQEHEPDTKKRVEAIEKAINDKNSNKVIEFEKYQKALISQSRRPKRKFWQIGEYFRRKKEDKAIQKMHDHLKSIGVPTSMLEKAKRFIGPKDTYLEMKNNLVETVSDRLINYKNRVSEAFKDYDYYEEQKYVNKKDNMYSEENYIYYSNAKKEMYEKILPIYKTLLNKHNSEINNERNEFEQKDFEQEKSYLDHFENMMCNKLHISSYELHEELEKNANRRESIVVDLEKDIKHPIDKETAMKRGLGIHTELVEEIDSEEFEELDSEAFEEDELNNSLY